MSIDGISAIRGTGLDDDAHFFGGAAKSGQCGGEEKRPPFLAAHVGDSVGEEKRVYSVFAVNP